MHFSTLVLAAIAAVGATAAPAGDKSDANVPYVWTVHDFGVGCSPGGCAGGAYVSAPESKGVPSFNVTCGNTGYQTTYVQCTHGKHSDHISFYWAWAEESSVDKINIFMKYKVGTGKTWFASDVIPNPGYQQTTTFHMKPKSKDS